MDLLLTFINAVCYDKLYLNTEVVYKITGHPLRQHCKEIYVREIMAKDSYYYRNMGNFKYLSMDIICIFVLEKVGRLVFQEASSLNSKNLDRIIFGFTK